MTYWHPSTCIYHRGVEVTVIRDGQIGSEGGGIPMLEKIISKARLILIGAQQRLSAESAAAVEQVYNDILALKDFIAKALYVVEGDSSLDAPSKKAARRGVFEQAGRKLEVMKTKSKDIKLNLKFSDTPAPTTPEDDLLQFLRLDNTGPGHQIRFRGNMRYCFFGKAQRSDHQSRFPWWR